MYIYLYIYTCAHFCSRAPPRGKPPVCRTSVGGRRREAGGKGCGYVVSFVVGVGIGAGKALQGTD